MSMYLGDFAEDATVYIHFTTNAADGGRESLSATIEEADITILKDGTGMTLDASTITINFEAASMTGAYVIAVDMSNDADFTTGSEYAAVLYPNDETVDSQDVVGVIGVWSCENRADFGTLAAINTKPSASAIREEIDDNSTMLQAIANVLGNFTGTGVNTILGFFKALMSKSASTPSDVGGTFDPATDSVEAIRELGDTSDGKIDTLDTNVDAVLVDTGTTIPARLTGIEGSTFDTATDSLEAIRDRGDAAWTTGAGGAGSGARTVTITVDDGSSALQNATVRMTEGVNTYTATTNVSGVAVFNLDDATYTVGITKSGYTYSGTTLVVNGTEAETYSMTAVAITPSAPGYITGYGTIYDQNSAAESGVTATLKFEAPPIGDSGSVYDSADRTTTSSALGYYEFTSMVLGAKYTLTVGSGSVTFRVPASGSTFTLPSFDRSDA